MTKKRTEKYQRNQERERLLQKLNNVLADVERKMVSEFEAPEKPTLFIVGAPRSATTLTHQLMAQTNQIGYISNYVARFWLAPYLGSLQEKALGLREEKKMSFNSDYGRTEGWHEPHTFHYFWHRWFDFDSDHTMEEEAIANIDKNYFRSEIAALESIMMKPMLFRSLYCGLQIDFLKKSLKNAKFVVCTRNPLFQAQSILLARKAYYGTYEEWFSLKPPEYRSLRERSVYRQVAGQIYYILKEIGNGLADMDQSEYIVMNQANLVDDPRREITRILNLAGLHAENLLDEIPRSFENRNEQHLGDDDWAELQNAVFKYFEGRSSSEVLLGSL